jgi:hypothetical protein
MNDDMKYFNMASRHAEMDVIRKIRHKKNVPAKVDLLVIRLSKTGILGESKPCYHCMECLRDSNLGIQNIFYSTADGKIVKETFSEMKEGQLSSGMLRKQRRKGSKNSGKRRKK